MVAGIQTVMEAVQGAIPAEVLEVGEAMVGVIQVDRVEDIRMVMEAMIIQAVLELEEAAALIWLVVMEVTEDWEEMALVEVALARHHLVSMVRQLVSQMVCHLHMALLEANLVVEAVVLIKHRQVNMELPVNSVEGVLVTLAPPLSIVHQRQICLVWETRIDTRALVIQMVAIEDEK